MEVVNQATFIGQKKSKVTDDYQVIKKLGRGTYSEVYLARNRATEMERCIKVIKKKNLSPTEQASLLEEVKILRDIDHPHIMRVFEYYDDPQNLYIVAEHLSGGELFDYIVESKSFNESEAARLMHQILSAVSYMHKHNIAHRDLKPENIVLENSEASANVKIIDFGTSKRVKKDEKLKTKLGTAYYIAPEVLKNSYSLKCDIWSCGVMLYVFLCGYPPFNAKSDDEIFKKVLAGNFAFHDEEWAHISPEAKALVRRMLTYDQLMRPSADELLRDPWFAGEHHSVDPIASNSVLKNLASFNCKHKIQNAVLIYFVSCFDISEDRTQLLELFKDLDKDHDGQLTKEELVLAFRNFYANELDNRIIDSILQRIDFNNSDAIDFTEFLVANVKSMKAMNEEHLVKIFEIIDKDHSGAISSDELMEFLNLEGPDQENYVKHLISEVDKNKDGILSLEEFKLMMNDYLKS